MYLIYDERDDESTDSAEPRAPQLLCIACSCCKSPCSCSPSSRTRARPQHSPDSVHAGIRCRRVAGVAILGPAIAQDFVKSSTALGYGRAAQDLAGVVVPTAPTLTPAKYADAPASVTAEEVLTAQKLWADSIALISKVYLNGSEAAGKL